MILISGVIGILLIVLLFLRIAQMTGGVTTTIKTVHGYYDKEGNFYPDDSGRNEFTPLPIRTEQELEQQASSMPIEWVTYLGATPPLKLKIRGTSEEMYRRVCRKYIDQIGQENFLQLPREQMLAINQSIKAEAYVLDWEGAQYPNGAAMPFAPSNLAILLGNDPYLDAFLSDQVARISPKWDTK